MTVHLTDPHRQALDEFTRTVRARLGQNLVTLTLFGSRARGDAAPDSDIDVLVVVTERRLEAEDLVLDIAFDVNLAHDVYISPRVIERSTLEHPVPGASPRFSRRSSGRACPCESRESRRWPGTGSTVHGRRFARVMRCSPRVPHAAPSAASTMLRSMLDRVLEEAARQAPDPGSRP